MHKKTGTELSVLPGFMFNTENPDTDYQSGHEFHLDFVVNQFLAATFAVGFQGYYYKQLTGGSGAVLGDFKGELASMVGACGPNDRPIDGVDQTPFFLSQTDTSSRAGILIWCDNRLQAVKWRNYKVHFYQQETMVSPPVKLALPYLFNLYTNPREDEEKPTIDSWVLGPVLKLVAAFEESAKKHPLIPMGTPDPYQPRTAQP